MKLSEYAKLKGVSYKTAWRWFKDGKLDAEQMDTGTVIIRSAQPQQLTELPYMREFLRLKTNPISIHKPTG